MISLIIGNKGAGKTKKLIELVNEAVKTSDGNVVCVEKEPKLTYDIDHKARLLETDSYQVTGMDAFYGFLCGICAGNYDVTDILIDATFKIVGRDYNQLPAFFNKLSHLSEESKTNFVLTISCDEADLPAAIFESCQKL